MRINRDPNDGKTWHVRPHDETEAALLTMLLTALAEKYPDPPPERVIPLAVLDSIGKTSDPEVALEIVKRLNITPDSEATLGILYEWCEHAQGMAELEAVVRELLAANLISVKFRVIDPRSGHGLDDYSSRAAVPEQMMDDNDEEFEVTKEDVREVYFRNADVFPSGA
jgi:hypothetical protein